MLSGTKKWYNLERLFLLQTRMSSVELEKIVRKPTIELTETIKEDGGMLELGFVDK